MPSKTRSSLSGVELRGIDFLDARTWPLFTQAVVSASGQRLYCEALLRHTQAGFDAGAFILSLETAAAVERLDTAMLTRVCRALAGDASLHLGVNVSRQSLISAAWQGHLQRSAPPEVRGRLVIEITETARLAPPHASLLAPAVEALTGQGFAFALDDFGKGAATRHEIETLPLAYVKMDQDLTAAIAAARKKPSAPAPLISLADLQALERTRAWTLIAEGVEDSAQHQTLKRADVHAFQGFAIERPQPSAY